MPIRTGSCADAGANVTDSARTPSRLRSPFLKCGTIKPSGRPRSTGLFIDDRIAQHADALDFDLANVAVLHPDRRLASKADA